MVNQDFRKALDYAHTLEGMITDGAIGLFHCFLTYQNHEGITGDCVEFGVYMGKSASVIAHYLQLSDTLHLVDNDDWPALENVNAVNAAVTMTKAASEDYVVSAAFRDAVSRGVRFSHHDASHFFSNVTAELEGLLPVLGKGGIMVLDDFGFSYSQIMAAFFYCKYQMKLDLELILLAENKAFICRKQDFQNYEQYVLGGLEEDMKALGFSYQLVRTDNSENHRAFALLTKPEGASDRYGESIFGDRFYKPTTF